MSEPKQIALKETFRICFIQNFNQELTLASRSQLPEGEGSPFPVDGVERGHGVALGGHQPVDQEEMGEQPQS